MNISLKRIQAIFIKDYKEFSRNYAISIMMVFPIFFAMLYGGDGVEMMFMSAFVLNFSLAMLTSFVQACLIAEEKEKNTLRSLMMTPASMFDVLLGKSSFVFVMSAVVLAITVYLLGYVPTGAAMGWFIVAMALSIILYSALGTICGLFSKTVMEATLAIFPVIIIFTLGQFGAMLVERFPIAKVLEYLPSAQLADLMQLSVTAYTTVDMMKPVAIIAAWTIVVTIVSVMLYKKRLMDE